MEAVFLSRLQFALTTMFHILFPVLTIGLSVYLVAVEGLWLWTRSEIYYRMYRFWVKIFAIHFAVGVVTGIVLEFEFGSYLSETKVVEGHFAGGSIDWLNPFTLLVGTAFCLQCGDFLIGLFRYSDCRLSFGNSTKRYGICGGGSTGDTPLYPVGRVPCFTRCPGLHVLFVLDVSRESGG